jgi:two-component system, NarL family, nitrate/nitrite response regulator NarL
MNTNYVKRNFEKRMTLQQLSTIRILIIDDHAVLRIGLRSIIEADERMAVVGEAADRNQAIALASTKQPDIILLDLDLGSDSGFDLLPEMIELVPDARIIILTGLRDPEAHRRSVLLGAMGLVLKEKALEQTIKAIEKVYAGEVWLDRSLIAAVLNDRSHGSRLQEQNVLMDKIASLTEREREVVQLIGKGLRNQAISEQLVISEATVRNHLTSIYAKLGVNDRFELAVFAYRNGIIDI